MHRWVGWVIIIGRKRNGKKRNGDGTMHRLWSGWDIGWATDHGAPPVHGCVRGRVNSF